MIYKEVIMEKFNSKIIIVFIVFLAMGCSSSKFYSNDGQNVRIEVQSSKGYVISPIALYKKNEIFLLEGNVNNANQIDDDVRGHVDIAMITPGNEISVATANLKNISVVSKAIKTSSLYIRERKLRKSFFSYNLSSTLPRGSVIQIKYDPSEHQHKE